MYNIPMLIIIGPSASGKTLTAKILEKKYQLKKVVTHTTRAMRKGEVNDIDYHFVDKATFLKMKENNQFIETIEYNNNFYGTSKSEISDNKCVVLDPQGAEAFYNLHDKRIFIVFFLCSEETCLERMISRQDNINSIKERIASDRLAFNNDKQKIANVLVSSETDEPEVIADKIYKLYSEYLSSIK